MADTTLEQTMAYAVHDSVNQWLTEPSASKVFFEPSSYATLRAQPEYQAAKRDGRILPGGERLPDARGVKNTEHGDLTLDLEGLSGSGATNGVDASTLDSTFWPIIELLCGGTQASTGGLSDGTDAGSGATLELDTGDGAGFAAGDAFLAAAGSSGDYANAREVVSKSTDTLTADRAPTDDAGGAESFDENVSVFGARTAFFDNDVSEVANLAFFESGDNYDREYFGCFPTSAQLVMDPGQIVKLQLGGIRSTDWNTSLTSGALSYSAATTGLPLIAAPLILHIGATRYVAFDFGFDFGLNVGPRRGPGPNNVLGLVRKPALPKMTCTVAVGGLTAPQEYTDALRATHQGSTAQDVSTQDVSLQIGDTKQACMYIRMPAARVVVTGDGEQDGMETVTIELTATESPNHANVPGCCRIHLL